MLDQTGENRTRREIAASGTLDVWRRSNTRWIDRVRVALRVNPQEAEAFDSRDENRRSHCTGVVGHLVFAATSNWPGWIYFRRDFAARRRGGGICAGNLRVASRPLYLEMGSSASQVSTNLSSSEGSKYPSILSKYPL